MTYSKFVSIILPTRNRANFLESCIDSILAQTYSNWELIIVDGASMDNTPLIAGKYVEKDSRIRYYRSFPRQGLPKDRNIGISISNGDLIFFIEDDLTLEPDCLEILVNTFEELKSKNVNVGAVGPRTFLPEQKKGKTLLKCIWDYVGGSKRKELSSPCFLDKWTGIVYSNWDINLDNVQETVDAQSWSLLDKKILEDIGGYEEKAYKGTYIREEADLYFRVRNRGYKLYFQPKAVAYHERADAGGCNVDLPLTYYYYFFKNHIIFVIKNFGWKSLYMIPFFLFFIVYTVTKATIIIMLMRTEKRER
jgi:glycosyltransferase involved in cell wall biosynthesis